MLKSLFSGPYRIWAYIAMFTALSGFIVWYSNAWYNSGYNGAKAEMLKHYAESKKINDAKYKTMIDRNNKERERARKLQSELEKSKDLVSYAEIKQASNNSGCPDLGPDFVRVFNKIVGDPPGPKPGSDPGLKH